MIIETFVRIFIDADLLEKTVLFYEELLNGKVTLRFTYPEVGLELAAVSSPHLSVLIISGPPDQRAPFEATQLTIQVDRLESYVAKLSEAGLEQLQPAQKTRWDATHVSAISTALLWSMSNMTLDREPHDSWAHKHPQMRRDKIGRLILAAVVFLWRSPMDSVA